MLGKTPVMRKMNGIEKLEREVIKWALKRLVDWKKMHPDGLIPWGKPRCIPTKTGWNLVKAVIDLDRARKRSHR